MHVSVYTREERARVGEGGRRNEEERRVRQRGKSATLATTVTGTANYWLFALSFLGKRNRASKTETKREGEQKEKERKS